MDAEKLREIYNNRFQHTTRGWTTADRRKTQVTTQRVLAWLIKEGLRKKNPALLDVGCANGNYTEAFRRLGCEATGMDYSEVVVRQARELYPHCTFLHQNGFSPALTTSYDIIFCRGFSGFNTHDLEFIASWANKYIHGLSENGFLVLGFSSDFSGREKESETANHTYNELQQLIPLLKAEFIQIYYFHYLGWLSRIKKMVDQWLLRKQIKQEYYLVFRKN